MTATREPKARPAAAIPIPRSNAYLQFYKTVRVRTLFCFFRVRSPQGSAALCIKEWVRWVRARNWIYHSNAPSSLASCHCHLRLIFSLSESGASMKKQTTEAQFVVIWKFQEMSLCRLTQLSAKLPEKLGITSHRSDHGQWQGFRRNYLPLWDGNSWHARYTQLTAPWQRSRSIPSRNTCNLWIHLTKPMNSLRGFCTSDCDNRS